MVQHVHLARRPSGLADFCFQLLATPFGGRSDVHIEACVVNSVVFASMGSWVERIWSPDGNRLHRLAIPKK